MSQFNSTTSRQDYLLINFYPGVFFIFHTVDWIDQTADWPTGRPQQNEFRNEDIELCEMQNSNRANVLKTD